MKPKKLARLSLRVTERTKERLDKHAERKERSRNWLAESLLVKGLDRLDRAPRKSA